MEPTLQMNPLESKSVIEILYEVVTCDEPIEVTATILFSTVVEHICHDRI